MKIPGKLIGDILVGVGVRLVGLGEAAREEDDARFAALLREPLKLGDVLDRGRAEAVAEFGQRGGAGGEE